MPGTRWSRTEKNLSELLCDVPPTVTTPEIRTACEDAIKFAVVQKLVERFKRDYELGLVDKRMLESIINLAGPEAMPPIVVYLATDEAANINGQVFGVMGGEICIFSNPVEDKVIKKEEGFWTLEELVELVPTVLLKGYRNPAPPNT